MKAIKLFLPVVSLLFMAALSSCNREDGGRLLLGSDDAVKRTDREMAKNTGQAAISVRKA